jgi:DNA polymerase-3 subunit alpha
MGRKGKIVRIGFEDMEGAREVSIFSDQATAAGDALNEGRIIILRGRVQTFRDEPDIRVLEIIPVEQAYQRLTRRLILKLETNGKGDREGPGTRIMKGHRGGCPVLIDIPVENETRALLAVGEQFGVTPDDEFRKEVEELLGKDAVTYAV